MAVEVKENEEIPGVDDCDDVDAQKQIEKQEEVLLKQKYPQISATKQLGSHFLQKRLQQRKYFDSGDYNVAKSQGLKLAVTSNKSSTPVKQNLSVSVALPEGESADGSVSPTGLEIPRPETIPSRKTSLIQPEVGSKLSPLPHLFHSSPQSQQLQSVPDD